MYPEVYMDIGNKCNAMCKYCLTGSANRQGLTQSVPAYFMTAQRFQELAEHMRGCGMITPDCIFRIYNWYEPMLNPHLPEIINYIDGTDFTLDMSTNAGVLPDFSRIKSCKSIVGLLFSMPGFSQESYDRIHRLNFETVKDNIRTIMREFRARGFEGDAYINYHLYQFNMHEVYDAQAFADEVGIRLHCIFAYFNGSRYNGISDNQAYKDGTMTFERLKEVSKDLFFFYMDEIWDNPEFFKEKLGEPPSITLSEFCNIIPGRGCNDDSRIVNIFDLHSYEEVKAIYDRLQAEADKDPNSLKGWLWGRSYRYPRNYIFGLGEKMKIEKREPQQKEGS